MSDPIAHYDSTLNTALRCWVPELFIHDAVPDIRASLFLAGCGPFNNAYAAATYTPYMLAAIEAARQREKEGELEIDDFPLVSHIEGNGGCYVQSWVWVNDDEIDADEEDSDG